MSKRLNLRDLQYFLGSVGVLIKLKKFADNLWKYISFILYTNKILFMFKLPCKIFIMKNIISVKFNYIYQSALLQNIDLFQQKQKYIIINNTFFYYISYITLVVKIPYLRKYLR